MIEAVLRMLGPVGLRYGSTVELEHAAIALRASREPKPRYWADYIGNTEGRANILDNGKMIAVALNPLATELIVAALNKANP